jgi:DNA-directed RNA polymerase specialized sigma24 family protein
MSNDVARDEKKKRAKDPCETLPEEVADPAAEPRSNDIADRLQAIAATMSPKMTETVLMAFLGGMTAAEIAERTQATVSAVKARIRRGRSVIAAAFQAHWKGTRHDLDG